MRNRLLTLFAMALMAIGMNAQTWVKPVVTGVAVEDHQTSAALLSTEEAKDTLYVYNIAGEGFLGAGNAWGTQSSIKSTDLPYFLVYSEENEGYQFYSPEAKNQHLLGRESEGSNYTDYNGQAGWGIYWAVEKQANGNYRIRTAPTDATYGREALGENYDYAFLGWSGEEGSTVISPNIDPEMDGVGVEWAFVQPEAYRLLAVKLKLYALYETIEAEDLDVDYSVYTEIYNGTDVEALNSALAELSDLVGLARAYAVLRYGQDGKNPPSEDNPADGTPLIKNPSFDGNIDGWTCTFVSGQNATNVGYQGSSYTNGDVTISQFIEAWTPDLKNPNCSWAAIGDGELSQTMPSLPAGKYKFTCDAIAVAQWGNPNPVSGVQLFAMGGDIDNFQAIATGDGLPEHFEVTFVSTGGNVVLGLRTRNATANWIAADNFTLTYYGEVEDDPYKVLLDARIAELEVLYPDLDAIRANQEVIAAFSAALEAAKAATDDYQTVITNLNEAADALAASITTYKDIEAYLGELSDKITELSVTWPNISEPLGEAYNALYDAWENGTATEASIEETRNTVNQLIADYISNNVQPGDEVTILLTNPSFDTGNLNGWEDKLSSGAGFGTYNGNGENSAGTMTPEYLEEVGEPDPSTWGRNAEVYHKAFDFSQVIKQMPAGMYEFSCQGFWRGKNESSDDSDDTPAQLYAVINGEEQAANLTNLAAGASEDQLYSNGGGWGTDVDFNGLWAPYCMSGAMYHFHHKNDGENYDYTSKLNIILTEPADITVGVRTTSNGTWVIFDNFRIVYKGSDISIYLPLIEELTATALALGTNDGEILTKEAEDVINDAVNQAANVATAEDCIAAIQALQSAIAFGQQTLRLTARLQKAVDNMANRMAMLQISSSYAGLDEVLGQIQAGLEEGFNTNAEVEAYLTSLNKEFTKYVQYDQMDATETKPADITPVIYNPNGYDYDGTIGLAGWTLTDCNAGYSSIIEGEEATAEFFNQTYDLRQTIYGLAPGYYRLGVSGYYRNGGYAHVEQAMNGETDEEGNLIVEDKLATIFAGDAETPLLIISADLLDYSEALMQGQTITVNEETVYIPNSMDDGNAAFQNDFYKNILQFQVKEGQESVEIGLKKTEAVANDWTMWGYWTLSYLGTAQPTEDPTTAIQGVEAEAPAAAVIYNLAGQRVQKAVRGLYIVNGKKVVIK
ncbi:MAG: hypothetical protein IJ064_01405 [Bacteroidaceae bacterium]|nr:hypothetical protein [Bacteroidaceae bacterium]